MHLCLVNSQTSLQVRQRLGRRAFSLQAHSQKSGASVSASIDFSSTPSLRKLTPEVTTLSNNLVVASTGAVNPAVGLVWKIPAGSRYETENAPGASHYLRHALFAGNARESALALARKAELRGSQLYISNDRDSITIAVDYAHEDTEAIVGCVAAMIQDFKLEQHQMEAISHRVALDGEIARADPTVQLWDKAFEAAYRRNGLTHSPIYDSSRPHLTADAVTSFLKATLQRKGHIVAAHGVDLMELKGSVNGRFTQLLGGASSSHTAPKYFGGERRISIPSEEANHVLIGFGTEGLSNREEDIVGEILASLIGGRSNIPFGSRISHLPSLKGLLAKNPHLIISSQTSQCSDAGLLGTVLRAPKTLDFKVVVEAICKDLKEIITSGVPPEVLRAAKAQAAFRLATHSGVDGRVGQAIYLARRASAQLADSTHSPTATSIETERELKQLHSLSSSDFKSIASRIISRKPVYVSMGDLRQLPYLEEVNF